MAIFPTNPTTFFKIFVLVFLILNVEQSASSSILIVAPFFASSHSLFIHAIATDLASRGHNVTIITSNSVKDPPPTLTQVKIDMKDEDLGIKKGGAFNEYEHSMFSVFQTAWELSYFITDLVLSKPNVKAFIHDKNAHFDLVIVEYFYQDTMLMFSHLFNAPLVLLSTTNLPYQTYGMVGNPFQFSFMNHEYSRAGVAHSLWKRLHNIFFVLVDNLSHAFLILPDCDKGAREHFGHLEKPLPSIRSLSYKTELVITNTHFSYDETLPQVPAIVDAGGLHIEPVKKLPKDIQEFLDGAKNGVIVFALGSQLHTCYMRKDALDAFLQAFSKRNESILLKWEEGDPPKLNNVFTKKWIPINDVLAHPNVKAFINHGGTLTTQEAIDKGVPLISLPIYGDQFLNIDKLETKGAGVRLVYGTVTEKDVSGALAKVIDNPEYRKRMKAIQARFRDRPISPRDNVAYWIEYVIKHGSSHLKSSMTDLSWYEYYLVDVIVLLHFIAGLIYYALKSIVRLCSKSKKEKKE